MSTFAQKQASSAELATCSLTRPTSSVAKQDLRERTAIKTKQLVQNHWAPAAAPPELSTARSDESERKPERGKPYGAYQNFAQILVHARAVPALQTKLVINKPGDGYEQEADRVADQVMRMQTPDAVTASAPQQVSRKCDQCEEEGKLQKKDAGTQAACEAPAGVHEVLRSPGQPLAPETRALFEPRFGNDFSQVRIHADPRAAESARAVNALAYTVGNNIVFGARQYAPGTREGKGLLAHELVHVTQQEAAGNGVGYRLSRKKDEEKPQSPPKTKGSPPTIAVTPCLPKFKSLKAEITDSVGVREVGERCALILGTPGKANGATFTSTVDVPAGCTGTLQYVQLTNMCRSLHLTDGKDIRRKTGGDWIDTQDPIDQQQVSSSGSVEFKSNDSPYQPVAAFVDRVEAIDSFKTWLMWKPDQPADSNRVPLAIATWNWSAKAKVTEPDKEVCAKRWAVTQQKTTPGTGKATKESPAATKTVTATDPPTEDDKKC
jgi:Domain of unknown function (DUF4157)